MATPDYNCPGCGLPSEMVFGPQQAICTNDLFCRVLSWNPSDPHQEFRVLDLPDLWS